MNWIKMCTDLQTHPKVVALSMRLKIPVYAAVGALHAVWSIADQHSVDGVLDMTPEGLDLLTGIPGISAAMQGIGWLEVQGETVVIPDFDVHQGHSAKARAKDAARKIKDYHADKKRKELGEDSELDKKKSKNKSKDKTPHSPPEGGGVGVTQTADPPVGETPQIETPAPARTDSRGQTENFRAFLAAYPEARRDYGAARFWLTHCERDGPAILEGLKPWTDCELWKTDSAKVPGMRVFLEREQWRSKPPPPAPGEKPKADPAARFTPEEEKRIWAEADKLEAVMQGRYRAKQ